MTRKHQHPRRSGIRSTRATWLALALVALGLVAAPARAQAPSSFSPRLPADGPGAPGGPSLAFYAGPARDFDGHPGSAFGMELEAVRLGPTRGVLGILAGSGGGAVEAGLQVQPDREAASSPYVVVTWFLHDLDEGDSGIAFHVGAELRHTRELGLRLEGRAYLAEHAAFAALIGVAFR